MIKKKTIKKLQNKYRMIIYNDSTFAEVFSLRLSRINVYAVVGSLAVFFITVGILLVAFTPLKSLVPGYDLSLREKMYTHALKMDSLEKELERRDILYNNIKTVLDGGAPGQSLNIAEADAVNGAPLTNAVVIDYVKTKEDSLLQELVETEERFNLTTSGTAKESFTNLYMYPPVKGVVTSKYNSGVSHYGVDIVAPKGVHIMSVLKGTVISSEWTVGTGYVIQIQHADNLVSVYKHNSELLKKVGDRVKEGEAIAIIGNTGELTDGPHLHFELWYKGIALNPEDFIAF